MVSALGVALLGVIGATIFSKRATVDVPFCEKHERHWGIRIAIAVLGILVMVSLGVLVAVIASEDEDLAPFLAIPLGVVFLGWLGTMIYMGINTIRPMEITDKSITLKGVCQEFIDALDEARRGEDDRSRRGRAQRDDDNEDDRPRSRGAAPTMTTIRTSTIRLAVALEGPRA